MGYDRTNGTTIDFGITVYIISVKQNIDTTDVLCGIEPLTPPPLPLMWLKKWNIIFDKYLQRSLTGDRIRLRSFDSFSKKNNKHITP